MLEGDNEGTPLTPADRGDADAGASQGADDDTRASEQQGAQQRAQGQASAETIQEQLRAVAQGILAIPDKQKQKEAFMALEPPQIRVAVLQAMEPDKLREFQAQFTAEEQDQIMRAAAAQQRKDDATDDDDDKSFEERQKIINPDIQREDSELEDKIHQLITDGNLDDVKPLLAGMTKTDAANLLRVDEVDEDAITRLTEDLTDAGDEDSENPDKGEEMQDTRGALEEELDYRKSFLEAEMDKEGVSEEDKAKLEGYHRKVGGLLTKLTDYFAEGEPGRKYARKGGKILYIAILTAIVLLLLEMNIIYKASKRK